MNRRDFLKKIGGAAAHTVVPHSTLVKVAQNVLGGDSLLYSPTQTSGFLQALDARMTIVAKILKNANFDNIEKTIGSFVPELQSVLGALQGNTTFWDTINTPETFALDEQATQICYEHNRNIIIQLAGFLAQQNRSKNSPGNVSGKLNFSLAEIQNMAKTLSSGVSPQDVGNPLSLDEIDLTTALIESDCYTLYPEQHDHVYAIIEQARTRFFEILREQIFEKMARTNPELYAMHTLETSIVPDTNLFNEDLLEPVSDFIPSITICPEGIAQNWRYNLEYAITESPVKTQLTGCLNDTFGKFFPDIHNFGETYNNPKEITSNQEIQQKSFVEKLTKEREDAERYYHPGSDDPNPVGGIRQRGNDYY